jgi:hypothetical protein
MANRWFRRRWDASRGDQFDSWGAATYYFETDDVDVPIRQVEVYDAGPTVRYDSAHAEDEHGQLAQSPLTATEDWTQWAITSEEFEQAWGRGAQH